MEPKKNVEAIAQMWKDTLGVESKEANSEFKVFIEIRSARTYSGVARGGWIADFNAIDNFADMWTCNNADNYTGYCNPEYDKLIKEGEKQPNPTAAKPYFTKALNLVMADYPIIPLYSGTVTHLVKPYIKGYQSSTNHLDHVYDKWLSFNKKK